MCLSTEKFTVAVCFCITASGLQDLGHQQQQQELLANQAMEVVSSSDSCQEFETGSFSEVDAKEPEVAMEGPEVDMEEHELAMEGPEVDMKEPGALRKSSSDTETNNVAESKSAPEPEPPSNRPGVSSEPGPVQNESGPAFELVEQSQMPAEIVQVPSLPAQRKVSPTHAKMRATTYGSKKVHSSPDEILLPISPYPACSIRLNFNDHRFTAKWRNEISSEIWIDTLANNSYSNTFTTQDWKSALKDVHKNAWEKWSLAADSLPALQLGQGIEKQDPGVIPPDVYNRLEPIISALPERKAYSRH